MKSGPGGIRDVEFTVQFLQLLHGHEIHEVRGPATLPALRALAEAQAITEEERAALEAGYRFLRTAEHRVQILHEIATHLSFWGEAR